MTEFYKGFPKTEVKESIVNLRKKGLTDEDLNKAFSLLELDRDYWMNEYRVLTLEWILLKLHELRTGQYRK